MGFWRQPLENVDATILLTLAGYNLIAVALALAMALLGSFLVAVVSRGAVGTAVILGGLLMAELVIPST